MYHLKVVEQKIERALSQKLIPRPPTYYSRPEIEANIKHFDSIYDFETNQWTRDLAADEVDFIRMERFLCRVDFKHLANSYCWIKSAEDLPIRFNMWPSQQILLDIISENELEGISIELMILKARQLGISRFVSLLLIHRCLNFSHLNVALASSTPDKTGKLASMVEFTMDHIPHWLKPGLTADRHATKQTGGIWREWTTGTTLTLQHGAMMTGIARGETPTVNWLSEVSEYANADEIDSSLFRAIHQFARVMTILESTAMGTTGWWHDTWWVSKEGWAARRSRLRPVFLPFFVGGLYPTKDFIKRSPVPDSYHPALFAIEAKRRAEEYVHSDPLLSKYLGKDWRMPVEQQWFYEVERSEAERKDRLPIFLQEMPMSDVEAFQNTERSVFGPETVQFYRDRVRTPLGVYGLVGPDHIMPYRIQPHISSINPDMPRIEILYEWGPTPIRFELVPLRWQGYSVDAGQDKIYIFEHPEPGEIYALGVDTSEGIGADLSTIEGLRKSNSWRPAGQVCEFASNKLNAEDMVPYVQALGAYYSTPDFRAVPNPEESFRRQCRLAIECKGTGSVTQKRIQLQGWSNFHPWMRDDNREIDLDRYHKIGIFTVEWFRNEIITMMNQKLRDHEIDICSPYLVREFEKLIQMPNGRIEGNPDDRFFGMGFAVITLYQWERTRPIATAPPPKPQGVITERRYMTYPMTAQEKDTEKARNEPIFSDERRLY